MKIVVRRMHRDPGFTISALTIDGARVCYVLEDTVREVLGKPVAEWKIPGKTAIPIGIYPVNITWSSHFQKMLPLIGNVPDFEGVRIHPGNTDADTEGCLLVGLNWGGGDFISESVAAFSRVFPLIQSAWSIGEIITLEIT